MEILQQKTKIKVLIKQQKYTIKKLKEEIKLKTNKLFIKNMEIKKKAKKYSKELDIKAHELLKLR